jgi:hypothetical protein
VHVQLTSRPVCSDKPCSLAHLCVHISIRSTPTVNFVRSQPTLTLTLTLSLTLTLNLNLTIDPDRDSDPDPDTNCHKVTGHTRQKPSAQEHCAAARNRHIQGA